VHLRGVFEGQRDGEKRIQNSRCASKTSYLEDVLERQRDGEVLLEDVGVEADVGGRQEEAPVVQERSLQGA